MKKYFAFLVMELCFAGCRKEYKTLPPQDLPEGPGISIREIREKISLTSPLYKFGNDNLTLYCTVTADESSGNFYKEAYVCDAEGAALRLGLLNSGGLYIGDRIRINLNGMYVSCLNNSISLDTVDLEKSVIKLSSGNVIAAKTVKIQDIIRYQSDPLHPGNLQGQLVELNGVEFLPEQRNQSFGDAVNMTTSRRELRDCQGNELSLSTSGFANFAGKSIPAGNGKVLGIIEQYKNSMSLVLRNYYDVQMNNPACLSVSSPSSAVSQTFTLSSPVIAVNEAFDGIISNVELNQQGWINYNETGSVKWKGNVKSSTYKAIKATSFSSGETNTIWLISPPVIYHSGMTVSFKTGVEYWDAGHPEAIMAYVCTNFDGANFKSANWTPLVATYANGSEGNYTGPAGLKPSGEIKLGEIPLLDEYVGNLFIAFRYYGNSKYDSNVFVDDIIVK